jgi:predicted transcriptional regulator
MWISDAEKVRAIVNALSDEYSKKIMVATTNEAKSPEQISSEQNIPVSTCYRRIHDLLVLSIIRVNRIDLANGKKSVLYKSAYKNIVVKFEKTELQVDLVPNTDSTKEVLVESLATGADDSNNVVPPSGVIRDCDLCQADDVVCKVFVTGDSKSYLSVCERCERKMKDRDTIRAVENVAKDRLAQSVYSKVK